jgi:hypothetical protein
MKEDNLMSEIKTVDPRGLEHHEREALIFPGIEGIKKDETLRIIMEFNPIPLVYMLQARNEFEINYEKEGPAEWIVAVKRIAEGENRKEQFKQMLHELKEGDLSEETKEKAKTLLQAVDAKTLGIMEQELIRKGVSHEEIRKSLCDIHLEVLKDSLEAKRIEVDAPHPVNSFMEEHKIILESLNQLGSVVERFKKAGRFEDMGRDLEKLKDISHHLVEAESHHQREEEVLFPKLEAHDIVEPGAIMKMDHEEFRKRKQALFQLSHNSEDYRFDEFRERCVELGEYLIQELESHIFKEDNILYQIALQTLSNEEWEQVKKECDKIGYCCFTPEDLKK